MAEKEKKEVKEEDEKLLQYFAQLHFESENYLTSYKARWVKNTQLVKGIFPPEETRKSKVRNRSKLFFRKIWATKWRIIGSMYQAFMKEDENFNVEGVDTFDDPRKAKILETLMAYRKRQMQRKDDLFIQFLHAFEDIFDFGFAAGKMTWSKKEKRPKFILYPPEQVMQDMSAETRAKRQYIIFVNYLTKDELEQEYGDDIDFDKLKPTPIPNDQLRASRFDAQRDPMRPVTENMYPSPGKLTTQEKESFRDRYETWEVFWKAEGKIKFAVTQRSEMFLKEPVDSPYGNEYFPDVTGSCLLEAHKLVGEGFPGPLEGPQESLNHILNMRKDELSLSLSPMNLVNRYANVDIESLNNVRPAGTVWADSINDAVTQLQMGNVTQTAYMEAAADEEMMKEMSGVTDIKRGEGREQKTGVAQINLAESNVKIDVFIAVVAETFIRNFYFMLGQFEQRFETDKKIFRIANERLRQEGSLAVNEEDIWDLDDFEADFILHVTPDKATQSARVQQKLAAMDKMIMANQSLASLLEIPGAVPPEGLRFFDLTAVMEELLPQIGIKNYKNFFFQSGQPLPEASQLPIGSPQGNQIAQPPIGNLQGLGL